MKKSFIKDLQFGDKLADEYFAVKDFKKGKTYDHRDYLDLTLVDKTGEIMGKVWEAELANCENVEVGDIVSVNASVSEFKDKQQLKVTFMQKVDDYEVEDFLPVCGKDINVMWDYLEKRMKSIKNKDLKQLLDSIFDNDFKQNYLKAPAAERIHHAYIGGLVEHSYEMMKLADTVLELFPDIDSDLLVCGVVLHDIGKMEELGVNHTIFRTLKGSMVGHISLGAALVSKKMGELKDFPEDLFVKIMNMMLGHHEMLEFGSPVKPMTKEAFALCMVDNLSAKMNIVKGIYTDNEDSDQELSLYNPFIQTKMFLK